MKEFIVRPGRSSPGLITMEGVESLKSCETSLGVRAMRSFHVIAIWGRGLQYLEQRMKVFTPATLVIWREISSN